MNYQIIYVRRVDMSRLLRNLKKEYIVTSLISIAVGVFFVIFSQTVTDLMWFIFAGALVLFGVVKIIEYFTTISGRDIFRYNLAAGLCMVFFGIFVFIALDLFKSFFPFILGLIILIAAFVKFQQSIELLRNGYGRWWIGLISSAVLAVLAVVILFNLGEAAGIPVILVGIGLIFNGISELWTVSRLNKILRKTGSDSETIIVERED